MRFSLFYNPLVLIDRLAVAINRYKRKAKLKGTPARNLKLGHLDSLELLEIIKDEKANITTIFDVGANVGTWTLLAKSFFTNATVHAFEPLGLHINKFKQNTNDLDKTKIHTYCLGDENKQTKINISSFSDSSSILDATPLEFKLFGIKKTAEELVDMYRIEDLINKQELPIPNVIKIDVQGYELEVLKGAGSYLNQVGYLIVEVSFKEYYVGQPLFLDIANYLFKYNFHVHAFGHSTPIGQELGQIDVLFKHQKQ